MIQRMASADANRPSGARLPLLLPPPSCSSFCPASAPSSTRCCGCGSWRSSSASPSMPPAPCSPPSWPASRSAACSPGAWPTACAARSSSLPRPKPASPSPPSPRRWPSPAVELIYVRSYGVLGDWPLVVGILRLVLSFAVLIVPTTLMGATLPLVVKASLARGAILGRQVSLLYAFNTAGAVVRSARRRHLADSATRHLVGVPHRRHHQPAHRRRGAAALPRE